MPPKVAAKKSSASQETGGPTIDSILADVASLGESAEYRTVPLASIDFDASLKLFRLRPVSDEGVAMLV
jgi:hypothetical protein